jgi:hypothetical protein
MAMGKSLNIDDKTQHKYRTSKKGLVTIIYLKQKESSIKRGHRLPEYTKKELSEWLYSKELFHILYSEWVMSGYLTELKPSIDRINSKIHYCFNNIQLTTWSNNQKNNGIEISQGNNREHANREVHQYSKEGDYMASYISTSQAGRETKACQSKISCCINGTRVTAGKFFWKDHKVEKINPNEELLKRKYKRGKNV